MFLGLLDPDPLVRGMDPDPDLLSFSKNSKKTLISTVLRLLFDFIFEKMMQRYLQRAICSKTFLKLVFCWRLEGQ
jgi:hypothetical protein